MPIRNSELNNCELVLFFAEQEAKANANFPGFRKGDIPPWIRSQMILFTLQEGMNTATLEMLKEMKMFALQGAGGQPKVK